MANINITSMAGRQAAQYIAAGHIFKHGPQTPSELFSIANFGLKNHVRNTRLERAIDSGWLVETTEGKVDIGVAARKHFELEAAEVNAAGDKPVGQIAAPRQPADVFGRPPLNKKYIPNRRGSRQDVPEWSVRADASFKTLAGGDA